MKRIILILLCSFIALNGVQAKQIPEFVQHRLDSISKEARRSLRDYRVWDFQTDGYKTLPLRMRDIFSDKEYWSIDSLDLDLNVSMIYDDEMRNRIVQLVRNEFQEWELDSLVNSRIMRRTITYEREARKSCKFDTLQIFRVALDSFYVDLKNKNPEDSILVKYEYVEKYKYEPEIFKMLQLDTTSIFRQAYSELVERERESEREDYLTNGYRYFNNYTYLAELSGYIGDKRFVQPLIELLDKSEDYQKERIIEALARLRAEPYYTDYVKERMPRTIEQIQNESPNFRIDNLVYILGTQESFRELSKYLLSDYPEAWDIRDLPDGVQHIPSPMWRQALRLIDNNIKNNDLQEIIGGWQTSNNPELTKLVYDWMQKNYSKYEIRRIW